MEFLIEEMLKKRQEEQEIKCPHCDTIQPNDDYQYPVSYYGEEGTVEMECPECEKKFWVKECVRRIYIVGKAIDYNGFIIEE